MDQLTHRLHPQKKNQTTPPPSSATFGEGAVKRKCADTPLYNQPLEKSTRNYSGAAKVGTRYSKKDHKQILWVHSTETEKGSVAETYFNLVVSKCNRIKIDGINNDDEAHMWSPAIRGQPIYDATNNCGKIICCNKKLSTSGSSIYRLHPRWLATSNLKRGLVRSKNAKMLSTPV